MYITAVHNRNKKYVIWQTKIYLIFWRIGTRLLLGLKVWGDGARNDVYLEERSASEKRVQQTKGWILEVVDIFNGSQNKDRYKKRKVSGRSPSSAQTHV